jgi:predicted RNA methylase
MEAVLATEPPAELPPELAASVDAWIAGALERAAPLTFSEIRKGVQALSQRYVERRDPGDALASRAKRAAFAAYFAPLHLATAYGVVRALPERAFAGATRIVDLGAGSGAAGAGVALALARRAPLPHSHALGSEESAPLRASPAPILALDRSGFALAEARRTHAAFGLRGETQRAQLPFGIPKLARGDVAVLGWFLNECDANARERVLGALERGLDAGAQWLALEPLAGRAVPWWDEVAARFAARGCASGSVRWTMQRPEFVARMDKAAHLDHRELGARVLLGTARAERQ